MAIAVVGVSEQKGHGIGNLGRAIATYFFTAVSLYKNLNPKSGEGSINESNLSVF
jgi:hypothetical protein